MGPSETLANRVKEMLREHLQLREAPSSSKPLDDLGVDSLDRVEITNEIEELFGILVTDKEAQSWVTVGDVISYVATHGK